MKRLLAKVTTFIKKNSSLLLTIGAVGGVIGTAVVSAKCQKKLDETDPEDDISTVKAHIPTIIVATTASASVVGLYLTDKKKQAALVSAVMLVTQRYEEFRNKVTERDLDTVEEIDAMIMEEKSPNTPNDIFKTEIHSGEPILCYDALGERYFESSMEDLLAIRYQINRYFALFETMSANQYFEFMGVPETDWGDGVGWDSYIGETKYGYRWIDICLEEEELSDGLKVVKVYTPFEPHSDYMED